ncbi:MAG: FAD-dependent oxidoreductase [Ardenticatenales bacterium]|nr:FAD-dependent oxidoreductase [Ardenticatenales bacterium]
MKNERIDSEQDADVIVIGGGLAGLTAALALGQAGRQVILLEKAAALGGRAASQQKEGYTFNLGPHALYRSGAAFQHFSEIGLSLAGGLPNQQGALALTQGAHYLLPAAPASFLKTRLLSAGEKLQVGKALLRLMRDKPAAYASISISAYLDELGLTGRCRALLETLSRISTYGNAPDQMSAEILLHQYQIYNSGNVLYLDGGWQSLVAGLVNLMTALPVTIRLRERVVSLAETAAGIELALADGSRLLAGAAILAVEPEIAAELLPEAPLLTAGQPILAASLDVALRRLPDASFAFAAGLDKPYYYSVHTAAADLAPAGHALIHIAKYLAPTGPEAMADEAELETLLDQLQPGWRAELDHKRFLPHLRVVSRLTTAANGGLAGRQPVTIIGHDRIFLAGDWVGPEGWLADASIASALAAARAAEGLANPSGSATRRVSQPVWS